VQLGRQLDAGGAGADDGHVQLLGPQGRGLRMRADAGVDHAGMEALRVGLRLQLERMLGSRPGVPKSLLRLPSASTSVS
jgi:hypothetical protein